jgi:hypothetical protein
LGDEGNIDLLEIKEKLSSLSDQTREIISQCLQNSPFASPKKRGKFSKQRYNVFAKI